MTIISYRDQAVAFVVDDQAIVSDAVTGADRPIVNGMCLYAMQIADGDRPGPYRDADALKHAHTLLQPERRPARRRRRRCRADRS